MAHLERRGAMVVTLQSNRRVDRSMRGYNFSYTDDANHVPKTFHVWGADHLSEAEVVDRLFESVVEWEPDTNWCIVI